MLVREVGTKVRGGFGKAALLVYDAEQVALWTSFLTRMTDLKVSGLADGEALDTGQVVETAGVLVTTHSTFSDLLARKHIDLPSLALLVVDNIQASFHNLETAGFLGQYVKMLSSFAIWPDPKSISFSTQKSPYLLHACLREASELFSATSRTGSMTRITVCMTPMATSLAT